MTSRRRARGEEGSALVLALVFITVIGLLIGFVLAFVETTFKYSAVARTGRSELYAADGAMEAAIARVQGGGPCGDTTTTLNGVEVGVTCEPAPRPPPPPVEPAPSPAQAVLTLGSDPVEGFYQLAGSDPVVVRGDVFSHSNVLNISDELLHVEPSTTNPPPHGNVSAVGDCTESKIETTPLPPARPPPAPPWPPRIQCRNVLPQGAPDPAAGPDPGYPTDLTSVPTRRAVPACPPGRWLVSLEPGYYDDAVALSRLTDRVLCPNRVLLFKPGVYYFNFNFAEAEKTCDPLAQPVAGDPLLCTWKIDDPAVNVVGGTPAGWDGLAPDLASRPPIDFPGGCLREEEGVQFVFGGQSRVVQTAGKVELCPRTSNLPPPPGKALPPIAMYGLRDGVAQEQPGRLLPAAEAVSATPGFLAPENARDVDEKPARLTADAALSSLAPEPRGLTVRGFPGVPPGSRISSVKLQVTHRETGEVGKATVTAAGKTFDVARCEDYCDQEFDLGRLPAGDLGALSATYEVLAAAGTATPLETPKIGTESLDGIVLKVSYRAPAREKLRGCLIQPYDARGPSPASCALLKSSGAGSAVAIGGTVYAPTAAVDLNLEGVEAAVMSRGVIAASLGLRIKTAFGLTPFPVVALPDVHPKRAVLALGSSPGDGVRQTATSGRTLLRGDVFSQSDIVNESTAPLRVEGTVAAVGDCPPGERIDVRPPPDAAPSQASMRCRNTSAGAALPTEGVDPAYVAAAATVPDRQDVPTSCAALVIALEPGYYDDAVALTRLTSGACRASGDTEPKVVWLKQGVYYFDFSFAEADPSCADPNQCTWKITDPNVRVIGGQPPDKAGSPGTRAWDESSQVPPDIKVPGGCRNDREGVQLIFGGQSRLLQSAGVAELCPFRANRLAPPIPVYGLTRGAANEHIQSIPSTVLTSANFNAAENAQQIDEQPIRKTAVSTSPLTTSASITVGGFAPSVADVPTGSRFASAALRIVHRETGAGVQTVSVVTAGQPLPPQVVPTCADFCLTSIPLPGITSVNQLAGVRATYQVTLAGIPTATEELDGIELEVRYTPPSFRELSGCLVDVNPATACALIKAEGTAKLVLNGTVYAPTGGLDLDLGTDLEGLSSPVVNDGVIARTVRFTIQPAACYTGPAISHLDAQFPSPLPEPGAVFTACIGDTPVLRTRVTFPAAKVESWSVLR